MLTKRIIFNNAIVSRFMCSDIKSFSTSAINTNTPDHSKNATYPPVADFYAKSSVFLTGGTGYVGKVMIEKLLDSCKNIDKIFLLVREKKGVNPTDRINEIFDNPLFERLKKRNPSCLNKIIPISGDLTKPKLGLKSNDEQTLLEEVAVVLHSAASVKFNEPLSMSMKINFEGTKEMLSLLRRMKKVKSFVYVSTSFAHTHSKVLTETVYPPPAKLEDVYKFIEEFDHDEEKTMEFINGKPNTYTLCKALAESYVAENHGSIPTVIIRPSVVLGKKDEPAKGWMDAWQAAPLLVDNIGRGLNHFVLGDKDVVMDVSPVDYVANTAIVAATRAISEETKVFNCNSSAENPITWDGVFQHFIKENVKYRKNVLPFPSVYYSHSKAVIKALTMIFQTTPAVAADLWRRVQGKEPIYAPMMKHVAYSRDLIEFFTSHSIIMKANNTRALYQSLSPEDKLTYPCDLAEIDWPIYLTDCWKGLNKYLPSKYKV